ncbi:MAG: hypothetical protein H7835_14175 [Magnetococcus sp. XQGC-1]
MRTIRMQACLGSSLATLLLPVAAFAEEAAAATPPPDCTSTRVTMAVFISAY